MSSANRPDWDVAIVGAGLAGLTLARHLLLTTDCRVVLLDKRKDPPGPSQKVGESLVQLSGYYLSKVLDLEEHLCTEHFLKYNLRFHWPTSGRENRALEDYSNAFIRLGSNIATFQLDRNVLEEHLLELCRQNRRFQFIGGALNLEARLDGEGSHTLEFDGTELTCRWLIDASGRGGFLKKRLGLDQPNSIRHGSTWCWVDGLVNTEKLTRRSWTDVRLDRSRQKQGNFPFFLATNHFCAEGMWFWVIPLHGKTSLGLVYDKAVLDSNEVSNGRKMLDFVARQWPLFAEDFAQRKILDEGRYYDFSYDARQTISAERWAMTGEAGRFSDPLYSPGSDLISIYNTLIVDAIRTDGPEALAHKCRLYETVMRVMYEAYVPSYSASYDCLGDRQAFTYKYGWELAVYFGFYVLPFISDLFTDEAFLPHFLRKFGLLGPINRNLQKFLSGYYQWRKTHGQPDAEPVRTDFYGMTPLRDSEKLFYEVGLTGQEAAEVLDMQYERLRGFARWIVAQVYADVLNEPAIASDTAFQERVRLRDLRFDPNRMRAEWTARMEPVHA
ncbi:MAG: FAD-dependent oxidoreductase [Bryobacterales bacterium]|nr:FAD-dependent oxidoreductase [Bryobacterales bacterium]